MTPCWGTCRLCSVVELTTPAGLKVWPLTKLAATPAELYVLPGGLLGRALRLQIVRLARQSLDPDEAIGADVEVQLAGGGWQAAVKAGSGTFEMSSGTLFEVEALCPEGEPISLRLTLRWPGHHLLVSEVAFSRAAV